MTDHIPSFTEVAEVILAEALAQQIENLYDDPRYELPSLSQQELTSYFAYIIPNWNVHIEQTEKECFTFIEEVREKVENDPDYDWICMACNGWYSADELAEQIVEDEFRRQECEE